MKRISIAGIDGSGKTTLVTSLKELHQETILFSPQTYKDQSLPLYDLSLAIDKIGKWADLNQVPVLKGISLFLGMTLYREVVSFIENERQPKRLIVERHPLIDTMAYAKFFLPMLNKEMPKDKILDGLNKFISQADLKFVNQHIKKIASIDFHLLNFNYFIFDLLNAPREVVMNNLKNFYQLNFPDMYIILQLSPKTIPLRFTNREIVGAHENVKVLTILQDEMIEVCKFITSMHQPFRFELINADKDAPQVLTEVLEILKS